jgi:hypothetical protein
VSPDSVFYFDDAGPPCAAKKNSAAGEGGNKLACSREEEGGGVGGVKGEKNEEGETKGDGGKAEDNVLYTLPQGSGIIGVRYVAEETERERERERESLTALQAPQRRIRRKPPHTKLIFKQRNDPRPTVVHIYIVTSYVFD